MEKNSINNIFAVGGVRDVRVSVTIKSLEYHQDSAVYHIHKSNVLVAGRNRAVHVQFNSV